MTRVLVFGASVTAGFWDEKGGWVRYLSEDLHSQSIESGEDQQVYNLGVSGHSSREILSRMENEIEAREERFHDLIILISTGGNDALYNSEKKAAEVCIEDFKSNMRQILDLACEKAAEVYFIGEQPVDATKFDDESLLPKHSLDPERREKYAQVAEDICRNFEAHFISIAENVNEEDFKQKLFDGLHPGKEGHIEIYRVVADFLKMKSQLQF